MKGLNAITTNNAVLLFSSSSTQNAFEIFQLQDLLPGIKHMRKT
jgi:hypothetical protein